MVLSGCFWLGPRTIPEPAYEEALWTFQFAKVGAGSSQSCPIDASAYWRSYEISNLSFDLWFPEKCVHAEAGRLQVESEARTYRVSIASNQSHVDIRVGGGNGQANYARAFPATLSIHLEKGENKIFLEAEQPESTRHDFFLSLRWEPIS